LPGLFSAQSLSFVRFSLSRETETARRKSRRTAADLAERSERISPCLGLHLPRRVTASESTANQEALGTQNRAFEVRIREFFLASAKVAGKIETSAKSGKKSRDSGRNGL